MKVHSLGKELETEPGSLVVRPIAFLQPDRMVYPPSWLEHIPFAFWIVDVLRPRVFVELGTHSGNSYAALAQAVQHLGLDAAGYCIDTWKGDPQAGFYDESVFTDWKTYHDEHYAAFSTIVRSTFDQALDHFSDHTIDLLNIDGFHSTEAVLHDFHTWLPKISARGVVLMHDINVRERDFGAWRAWEQIRSQYPTFAFMHGHGLGVVAVGSDVPEEIATLLGSETAATGRAVSVRHFFSGAGAAVLARYRVTSELAIEASESKARALSVHAAYEASVTALRQEIERLAASATSATAAAAADRGRAEERIAWLQEEIGRRGQWIEEIERSRAELDRLLHDTQARTASLEAEQLVVRNGLSEWEQHATALDADRNRLQRELDETRQLLARQVAEIRALTEQSKGLTEQTNALGEELATMRESASWRMTSALRSMRRLLGKLRG